MLNKKYSMLSILTLISSPTYSQLYLCKACNPGTYATAGATSCTSCSAGTYQNLSGQSSCKTCGAGTYSNTAGATDCSSCSAGTYSSAGASSCSACTGNTYSNAGASSCTACASGQYSNSSHTGCVKKCTAEKTRYTTKCSDGTVRDSGYMPPKEISIGTGEGSFQVYTIVRRSDQEVNASSGSIGRYYCGSKYTVTIKYNPSTNKMDFYKGSTLVQSLSAKDC